MISKDKDYRTRSGLDVQIIDIEDDKKTVWPVRAAIRHEDGSEKEHWFTSLGTAIFGAFGHALDLIETKVTISRNKIYRTRNGQKVRIYANDGGTGESMVHGATHDGVNGWVPCVWFPDGSHESIGDFDLIEVKPRYRHTVWLNVHKGYVHVWDTREKADSCAGDNRVACMKVEIDVEEGEGL